MKRSWPVIVFLMVLLIFSGAVTGLSETPPAFERADGELPAEELSGQVKSDVEAAVSQRRQAQTERDQWQQEKEALQQQFKSLTAEQNRLAEENRRLQDHLSARETEIDGLATQLQNLTEIPEKLSPLLISVFNELEIIVVGDLPFLEHLRSEALASLADILADPDVSAAEKLRRTIELHETERTYGETIDAYQLTIQLDGESLAVNLFRLGRLSLFFQTPDNKRCGWYDPASERWRLLSEEYNQAITAAIDIAEKRRSVRILNLPLGRIAVP